VVFMWFDQQTLDLGPLLFFGGQSGEKFAGSLRHEDRQAHEGERQGCEGRTTEHQDGSALEI
jgi:hypothetical protein